MYGNKGARSGRVSHVSDREALGLGGTASEREQINKHDVLAQQDQILTEISENLTVVGHMASDINSTIEAQRDDLADLEANMTKANSSMEHVTRRTKALVDRAGGQRQCCIQVFLGVVALVLLMLVIYT